MKEFNNKQQSIINSNEYKTYTHPNQTNDCRMHNIALLSHKSKMIPEDRESTLSSCDDTSVVDIIDKKKGITTKIKVLEEKSYSISISISILIFSFLIILISYPNNTLAFILIFALFVSLITYLSMNNKKIKLYNDYIKILKLISSEDLIIKESFKIKVTSLITYLSKDNNINSDKYTKVYFPLLRRIIIDDEFFIFETIRNEEILYIK